VINIDEVNQSASLLQADKALVAEISSFAVGEGVRGKNISPDRSDG
jgi:hypothetical protein